MNDIAENLLSLVRLFADDSSLFFSATNIQDIEGVINHKSLLCLITTTFFSFSGSTAVHPRYWTLRVKHDNSSMYIDYPSLQLTANLSIYLSIYRSIDRSIDRSILPYLTLIYLTYLVLSYFKIHLSYILSYLISSILPYLSSAYFNLPYLTIILPYLISSYLILSLNYYYCCMYIIIYTIC